MTEFEKVLQGCLHDLELGDSSLDECLHRHPKHAQQLEPILLTSVYLGRARAARLSDAFKARVRTKLIQQMYAHPRTSARSGFMFIRTATLRRAPFMRLAASLAAIVLALLAAGTVYAQSALPGEAFYAWKLASENAWRAVSPDPVGTDLAIAERRADELIAVSDDRALYSQALEAYLEAADRLKSEADADNKARILEVLDSQVEELNQSGVILPGPDQEVPPAFDEPTLTPPLISTATPLPILATPQIDPTDLPQTIPTIEVPPGVAPTVQAPSEPAIEVPPGVVPTIQVPSEPTIEVPPVVVPTVEIPPLIP